MINGNNRLMMVMIIIMMVSMMMMMVMYVHVCMYAHHRQAQLFIPMRSGTSMAALITRFEAFYDLATQHIIDYMLFSGYVWGDSGSSLTNTTTTTSTTEGPPYGYFHVSMNTIQGSAKTKTPPFNSSNPPSNSSIPSLRVSNLSPMRSSNVSPMRSSGTNTRFRSILTTKKGISQSSSSSTAQLSGKECLEYLISSYYQV